MTDELDEAAEDVAVVDLFLSNKYRSRQGRDLSVEFHDGRARQSDDEVAPVALWQWFEAIFGTQRADWLGAIDDSPVSMPRGVHSFSGVRPAFGGTPPVADWESIRPQVAACRGQSAAARWHRAHWNHRARAPGPPRMVRDRGRT